MGKELAIKIEIDQSEFYEKKKWLYRLSLPLMWALTGWVFLKKNTFGVRDINTFWFDGASRHCREIKEGVASWRALDIIYNFRFGCDGKASDFWIGMINAQAVRNRLKTVKRELKKAIQKIAEKENEVRVLSIACGSAQAVIETIVELRGIEINTLLLDIDPGALDHAKMLAVKHGVEKNISCVAGSISHINEVVSAFNPQIIEMVGFLDYRPDAKAIKLIEKIYKLLPSGGIFLTANICPNPEQGFMKWVIDWPMIYREADEFGKMLVKGGFSPENLEIFCEPLRVHAVAVGRKPFV